MLAAIEQAEHSIALQSYIFDSDRIGKRIAQALIDAKNRGVEVRVLIDAVGSRYSHPPITKMLIKAGVNTALFCLPRWVLNLFMPTCAAIENYCWSMGFMVWQVV